MLIVAVSSDDDDDDDEEEKEEACSLAVPITVPTPDRPVDKARGRRLMGTRPTEETASGVWAGFELCAASIKAVIPSWSGQLME